MSRRVRSTRACKYTMGNQDSVRVVPTILVAPKLAYYALAPKLASTSLLETPLFYEPTVVANTNALTH
jgi:hypothetical protein